MDDRRRTTNDRRRTADDGRRTTDDGRQVMAKAYIAFGKVSEKGGKGAIIFHLILMKLGKKYDRNGGRFVFESLKLLLLYCECGLKFLPNKYIFV